MAAKLTRDWWKKKWPRHYRIRGKAAELYNTLAEYERAVRSTSLGDMEMTLFFVINNIGDVRRECDKTFKLDPAMKKVVGKALDELFSAADSQRKKIDDAGQKEKQVWSKDFTKDLKKKPVMGIFNLGPAPVS